MNKTFSSLINQRSSTDTSISSQIFNNDQQGNEFQQKFDQYRSDTIRNKEEKEEVNMERLEDDEPSVLLAKFGSSRPLMAALVLRDSICLYEMPTYLCELENQAKKRSSDLWGETPYIDVGVLELDLV
ncbi:hypothetical protein AgCh_030959 [Apium graveolens]